MHRRSRWQSCPGDGPKRALEWARRRGLTWPAAAPPTGPGGQEQPSVVPPSTVLIAESLGVNCARRTVSNGPSHHLEDLMFRTNFARRLVAGLAIVAASALAVPAFAQSTG